VAFREIVVTGKTAEERENASYRIASDLVWEKYDLDNGPLYRIFLIRLSVFDYILGVGLHHAIGDLISIGIMFRELLSIYNSVVAGVPLRVSPTRFRYMDYLASIESWSASPACIEHMKYWKDKLKSAPVTDFGNRPLNGMISGSTSEAKLLLDTEASRGLKKIAVQLKTTLFTVLLAIYKTVIWRMTGLKEPVVVALHAGRPNAGFQDAIGNFALEVAYKTCLAGNPGFRELVGHVMRTMNEANSHQPVPLDWVRRALAKDGLPFRAPGINFISGNTSRDTLEPRQLRFPPPGVRHGCHGFPASCAIEFRDSDSVIEGSMVYVNDLYDESTIHRFLDCFIRTVSNVTMFPDMKLSDFDGRR